MCAIFLYVCYSSIWKFPNRRTVGREIGYFHHWEVLLSVSVWDSSPEEISLPRYSVYQGYHDLP